MTVESLLTPVMQQLTKLARTTAQLLLDCWDVEQCQTDKRTCN